MKPIDIDKTPKMAMVGGLILMFIPIVGPIIDFTMFKSKCQVTTQFKIITDIAAFITHITLIAYIIAQ